MMQAPPFVNQMGPNPVAPAPAPAPAQKPMGIEQMYRSALLDQLASAPQQPATDALGAAGHLLRAVTDVQRQKKQQNFLLNNIGNGQDNWQTNVIPGV